MVEAEIDYEAAKEVAGVYPEKDDGIIRDDLTNDLIEKMLQEEGFSEEDYQAFVKKLDQSNQSYEEGTEGSRKDILTELTMALELLPQDTRLENILRSNVVMLLKGVREKLYAKGAESVAPILIPGHGVSQKEINDRSIGATVYVLYFKDGVCEVLLDPNPKTIDPLVPNGIRLEYHFRPSRSIPSENN